MADWATLPLSVAAASGFVNAAMNGLLTKSLIINRFCSGPTRKPSSSGAAVGIGADTAEVAATPAFLRYRIWSCFKLT